MKTFFIETYGCQMNVADSELVNSMLKEAGLKEAKSIDLADIIIFNTCSVRQHAEDRVLGRISNEASRKQLNPDLKIGVIGCMAQRLGDKLLYKRGEVDFVAGVDSYRKIPEIINQCLESDRSCAFYGMDASEMYSEYMPVRKQDFNAFVTIMRGCNNFCSYCIVPYVRGRERSRNIDDIIKEVRQAGLDGYKDITLLGQNVNSYNYGGFNFPKLLQELNRIDTIKRIRFVTSHPKDLSDGLIEVMATTEKVCEHIHLPMQSGNTTILEKMNRGYSFEHYINIISKLRTSIPNISISTDLIAGFPGETIYQFEDTLNAMKDIRFDFAFMFKYSVREGTAAANYREYVTEEEKLSRLDRMIELQSMITNEKYKEKIGQTVELYVEKISKKSEKELAGRTRDFKITVFPGDESLIGQFVSVKIIDATGWTLRGELIPKN
jgi:tRNA-2-methylthio-N6-dimethylallyladenosine synthase